jgi:choline dehydrogenase-like flavoprotein
VRLLVVGSGPSGVHFARTLLDRGHDVTMVDGGRSGDDPVLPGAGLNQLKEGLADPAAYFLGPDFGGVLLPADAGAYYGLPPHKGYIFEEPADWPHASTGFEPLFSFARGGLAEAWTAGCYPFNDHDLEAFPFGYEALAPAYSEVARRIGVSGLPDDMAEYMPIHDHLQPPVDLDRSSLLLLNAYERKRRRLRQRLGVVMGRSRIATLSRPLGDRPACSSLGRCLWGCPQGSLYTPTATLRECLASPRFEYLPGLVATRFMFDAERNVTGVAARPLEGGPDVKIPAGRVVLAAGALSTTRIFLESVRHGVGTAPRLPGLMDNRQVLVPFTHLRMWGRSFDPRSYQYNQLCMGIPAAAPSEYVHGLITTLTTAMIHPIAQQLPVDLGTATLVTRAVRSTLGMVNVNFHDTRRPDNEVWLSPGTEGGASELRIRYQPPADESERIGKSLRTVGRFLRNLGCLVPPGMSAVRPMGASVHYAGTLPMSAEDRPWTTRPDGSSRDFRGLFIADASTFPFLPAKNLTFTLMANAVRMAEASF